MNINFFEFFSYLYPNNNNNDLLDPDESESKYYLLNIIKIKKSEFKNLNNSNLKLTKIHGIEEENHIFNSYNSENNNFYISDINLIEKMDGKKKKYIACFNKATNKLQILKKKTDISPQIEVIPEVKFIYVFNDKYNLVLDDLYRLYFVKDENVEKRKFFFLYNYDQIVINLDWNNINDYKYILMYMLLFNSNQNTIKITKNSNKNHEFIVLSEITNINLDQTKVKINELLVTENKDNDDDDFKKKYLLYKISGLNEDINKENLENNFKRIKKENSLSNI